jgi:HEPN domain-containing protein
MANAQFPEAARAWFGVGDSDLRSAHALLALEPPETGTTVFHCRQAAEKCLKALLAFQA